MDSLFAILNAVLVLGLLGALFGLVLAAASKIFEVKKNPLFEPIIEVLPGRTAVHVVMQAAPLSLKHCLKALHLQMHVLWAERRALKQ